MKTRANLNNFLVMLVFSLATLCTAAAGETIYVDDDATGANDGSSWADAYKYLQDVLAAASSGDEIWVAEGTYKPDESAANPSGTGSRTATFQLKNGVGIYGGFAGAETSREQRDWQTNQTILSGDIGTLADNSDNSYDVVTGSGTDATAVLDGFTITGGKNVHYGGAGMYNYRGSPTVTNCTFSGNSALYNGGGMCNRDQSSPTLSNCTFSGNSAKRGGAIANWISSNPTVTNCTFSGNSAYEGGGIANSRSSPTLANCTFSDNSATNGGGMACGSPTVTNCTFSGNSAQLGGGIYNLGGSPTLTNCTFTRNSAGSGAGMYSRDNSNPMLTECEFTENVASDQGGGMYNKNEDSCPMVKDCTFSGNSAGLLGGGMCNVLGASPTVTNCTFSGNRADALGGGMYNSGGSPTVTNCTFAGNSANGDYQGGGGMANSGGSPTVTNCTFSANSAACNGGGMYNGGGSPTVTNCTFSGNSANGTSTYYDGGGGMWNFDGSPTVTNCTFRANSALNKGGGMSNMGPTSPTVTNCTFSGNSARNGGRAMRNGKYVFGFTNSPKLINCILWDGGDEIQNDDGCTTTITYSNIQGGYTGTGNIALDPLFADADLRLLAGSPCINAGSNAALPPDTADLDGDGDTTEPIPLDLDGNPRIFNGTVDMGAYESKEEGPSIITVEIDIKPGSYPSSINLRSKGVTPVAIHTTPDFDATTVDPTTVLLNYIVAPLMWEIYDCDELPNPLYGDPLFPDEPEVIGDGDIDLVLYFETQELVATGAVEVGDEWAILTGETFGGTLIEGMGDVNIVVKKDKP